ncbi:GTP-binding protein Rheb homolog [Pollicipes pollicipes]|uniref:GTP-binding protein Rheb homolog n=1 Tax=Pollicipes pollicipes TaxID=41117 RepID=UPI0018856FDD|nr:GTP-binding protein Rheb homolog [Pollicipes pollicipes]XP_037093121.1 GTP-binding protein Rheb homolog [Pollicipes pollicipes]
MPSKQRKVAVLGFRSVGKSSLSIQFVDNQFVDSYDPTIENTFSKVVKVRGQEYEIKIVDTAGQDECSIMPSQYTMDVHGYVLVYSINSHKSFEVLRSIHDRLLDLTGKVNLPMVLVGNKTDLHREREISFDDGKRLADSWGALFLETSAKRNESVSDIFNQLVVEMERADGNAPKDSSCAVQ